ncbi:MAG: hypothetical protein M3314_06430, partial [Actinomycetota bacterium]|nr:hypothetical protein [Actinomycetota bacterium]
AATPSPERERRVRASRRGQQPEEAAAPATTEPTETPAVDEVSDAVPEASATPTVENEGDE